MECTQVKMGLSVQPTCSNLNCPKSMHTSCIGESLLMTLFTFFLKC